MGTPRALLDGGNLADVMAMMADIAQGLLVEVDPLEDRVKALQEARERKDILGWLKAAMPRSYLLPFSPLHHHLVKMRHEKEFGLEASRGSAKTAIGCVGLALYGGLEEPDLFDYFLNVQGTEKKALLVNLAIKLELQQNEVLRAVYGDQVGADKWTDSLFVTKKGVVYQAVSTGEDLRGTMYRMRRPNWVRLDDAYKDEDIHNPENTLKKNDWIDSTLKPMVAADRTTSYGHQGTAINDQDALKGYEEKAKLDRTGTIKFARFPAYSDETKTSLWPEQRTYEAWVAKREEPGVNPTIHAREYLCERRDESSSIVKPSWLHGGNEGKPVWEFDPSALRFDGRQQKLLAARLIVDPSIGKKEENDPTAMMVLLKSVTFEAKSADYWIMKLVNERLSINARILMMQDIVDHPPRGFKLQEGRIEDVAGFGDFVAEARRRIKGIGIRSMAAKLDKLAHLESKSWNFQNEKVHISTDIPKTLRDALYNQLTINHPLHDDLRDVMLHGIDDGVTNWADFL